MLDGHFSQLLGVTIDDHTPADLVNHEVAHFSPFLDPPRAARRISLRARQEPCYVPRADIIQTSSGCYESMEQENSL